MLAQQIDAAMFLSTVSGAVNVVHIVYIHWQLASSALIAANWQRRRTLQNLVQSGSRLQCRSACRPGGLGAATERSFPLASTSATQQIRRLPKRSAQRHLFSHCLVLLSMGGLDHMLR